MIKFDKEINKLWLDLDDTLANFTGAATKVFGMRPEAFDDKYGQELFWQKINADPQFFINLEPLPDMWDLYNAVRHLKPTILTGIPRNMNEYENQKYEWCVKYFGKKQKVICCRASKKADYCVAGDVIVDDREKYKKKWENKEGIWILHRSAKQSLRQLKELGVIN